MLHCILSSLQITMTINFLEKFLQKPLTSRVPAVILLTNELLMKLILSPFDVLNCQKKLTHFAACVKKLLPEPLRRSEPKDVLSSTKIIERAASQEIFQSYVTSGKLINSKVSRNVFGGIRWYVVHGLLVARFRHRLDFPCVCNRSRSGISNERASHDDATFAHDLNFVFNLLGLSNCYECFLVDSDWLTAYKQAKQIWNLNSFLSCLFKTFLRRWSSSPCRHVQN